MVSLLDMRKIVRGSSAEATKSFFMRQMANVAFPPPSGSAEGGMSATWTDLPPRGISHVFKGDVRERQGNAMFSSREGEASTSTSQGKRWREWFLECPPSDQAHNGELPTALSWARRRGPSIPESLLRKLFRKRLVRRMDADGQMLRALAEDVLSPGSVLLLPRSGIADSHFRERQANHRKDLVLTLAQKKWAASLILHVAEDFLILNKPAGIPVQGGSNVTVSIDGFLDQAYRIHAADRPRLVHRLDKDTSGCLIIARNAAAAAWISTAFRKRTKENYMRRSREGAQRPEIFIERTYWAICEKRQPQATLSRHGLIDIPLRLASGASGREQMKPVASGTEHDEGVLHATTSFRILKDHMGFLVLKLWPQTGRKHQLRVHCAAGLDSPILGDRKYGWLPKSSPIHKTRNPKLHLHCRKVRIRCPNGQDVEVSAPFPGHMEAALSSLGFQAQNGQKSRDHLAARG